MSPLARPRRSQVFFWASAPIGCALCGYLVGRIGASARSAPPPQIRVTAPAQSRYPLAISPDPIAMGTISAGRPAEAGLVVHNDQSIALNLERTVTSCPCIGVSGVPVRLGPNEAKRLNVAFDPTEDPEFRGELSVDISGYD